VATLNFSDVTSDNALQRICAKYLNRYGDWVVVIQIQQIVWQGDRTHSRLVMEWTPTSVPEAVNVNAAREARLYMARQVLRSIALGPPEGSSGDVATLGAAAPDRSPLLARGVWIILITLVALMIVVHIIERT
jgi:hypothetical protein